jgi:ATP-dependent helicase Lhr and Lhr-like helicase
MSAFDLLSTPIKHYVYDKRWESLRPIQSAAITRILADDRNYILASRTASGKTEAAFLPILSKVDFSQAGVRVLYISPLIALINDQFQRVEDLCKYLDVAVTKWHGEASRSRKEQLLKAPTGIVLITPESIEALFVNKPYAIPHLFASLQYVIVDEIHSFLGTDRGVQLQSLLSRLLAFQQTPFSIIGLSATIGDYQEAKHFTGDEQRTAVLLDKSSKQPDVHFKYYPHEGDELPLDLLKDLYKEVKDQKALIFPNTRGRAEEIAVKLHKLATRTGGHPYYFSHHSSVDKEVREYVEQFAKNSHSANFTISCTSTLELGIDIGSVDLVGQIDATFSIASLIQRVGRSGRRDDATSRLLFYATKPWSLLQAMACWLLYTEGFIEPTVTDRQAYDLLLHQALSITKQHSGMDQDELINALHINTSFREIAPADNASILEHLVQTDLLERIRRELIIGVDGEYIVNNKEFYSVFQTDEQFKVVHAGNTIGELPISIQLIVGQNILLAARIWTITFVDEKTRRIEVSPAADGKKPAFAGAGGSVHSRIREKMFSILLSDTEFDWLDETGRIQLQEMRQEFSIFPITDATTQRPLLETKNSLMAYTFTGTRINRTLAFLLKQEGIKFELTEEASLFEITQSTHDFHQAWSHLRRPETAIDLALRQQLEEFPSLLQFSKWGKYLPIDYQIKLLKSRYYDFASAYAFLDNINWIQT